MPRDIGPSGLTSYVAAAVARQIGRDRLSEIIEAAETAHGPTTEEEIQEKRDIVQRAREQQGTAEHAA